ncbi:MAG: CDP-diacylglycerol--serine O-phosphatidyltransferase [Sulfurovaceae bacterium]|nr:CDP-diacylglycerol--serine O-phosphatidyltransferase [Sulfurovaceae bacterium]
MKHRLAYILPNFFTASSIFLGMQSITRASQGEFVVASWFIIIAMIFDGLDGRIARATKTMSQFGAEFDSLADIVAFGVAPAMLIFFFVGQDFGRFGFLASALYVIFGALRLARFNSTLAISDPSVFIGLPIPAAASLVSMSVLFALDYGCDSYKVIFLFMTLLLGILMVSNIRYPSLKKIEINHRFFYRLLVVLTIMASLIYVYSIEVLALLIFVYVAYGPARGFYYLIKKLTS